MWINRDANNQFLVTGELSEGNAEEFEEIFYALPIESCGTTILDMSAFEVADGVAVAITINVLRHMLERTDRLKIIGAPQLLGHNLYRVGMLEANSRIELVDMRLEEPYG